MRNVGSLSSTHVLFHRLVVGWSGYNVIMEEATINFLHLCDAANIDSMGKISILGIFGKIFVPDLTRTPVKFTIVLSLAIKDLDPASSMVQIKIFGPDSEELRTQEPIA